MKTITCVLALLAVISPLGEAAFSPASSVGQARSVAPPSLVQLNEYIPSGMTKEQYRKLKQQEQSKKSQMEFARVGPKGFQSRSLQSFQQDLEAGKAGHLMPMFNAKANLQKGVIKKEDIPYMQRGGSWDNSDVKGAKKKEWNATDKRYAKVQPQKPGMSVDWSGTKGVQGPAGRRAAAAAPPSNNKPQTRKLFGMF